jgi:sarcosine oxidase subunit beta
VETTAGFVSARAAVIAAGPLSGLVAREAGVRLAVTAVRRQKIVLPDLPQVPPEAPMTIDEDTGVHWRPALGGAYLLYTDPTAPPTHPSDPVGIDHELAFRLLDPASAIAAARVAPFWREVWEHGAIQWMIQAGRYTMTADHRPLIGPTGVEGLWVNTGYSGHGVMASPAGSRRLADLLVGGGAAGDNPFHPERAMTPREAGPL